MGILDSIFGHKSNPMDEANKYLNQIPTTAHQYYDPYVTAGQDASGKTKTAYEHLMEDPTGFINKLMQGYQPSEGYQFQKGQLTKEMGNTAAAGGVAGTPMDQLNQAQGVQGLLGKDMQQFLSNVLGEYHTGLAGEQGIANQGFDASKGLTDILGGALNQQGGMAFQNAQQKNANQSSIFNAIAKALGGFAAGGPLGAAGSLFGGGTAGPMSGTSVAPWQNPG